MGGIEAFLRQPMEETSPRAETWRRLAEVLAP